MNMVMGHEIKAARQKLGESQERFARRLGVSQSTLNRWELHGVPERGAAGYVVASILKGLETRKDEAR